MDSRLQRTHSLSCSDTKDPHPAAAWMAHSHLCPVLASVSLCLSPRPSPMPWPLPCWWSPQQRSRVLGRVKNCFHNHWLAPWVGPFKDHLCTAKLVRAMDLGDRTGVLWTVAGTLLRIAGVARSRSFYSWGHWKAPQAAGTPRALLQILKSFLSLWNGLYANINIQWERLWGLGRFI